MATPTYAEIGEQVKRIEAAGGYELVLDLDGTSSLRNAKTGGLVVDLAGLTKQRVLTTLKRYADELEGGRQSDTTDMSAALAEVEYETPDVDVDTMATWEEKAGVLDAIALLLQDEKDWSADTLDMIAQEFIRRGWAGTDSNGFFVAIGAQ